MHVGDEDQTYNNYDCTCTNMVRVIQGLVIVLTEHMEMYSWGIVCVMSVIIWLIISLSIK